MRRWSRGRIEAPASPFFPSNARDSFKRKKYQSGAELIALSNFPGRGGVAAGSRVGFRRWTGEYELANSDRNCAGRWKAGRMGLRAGLETYGFADQVNYSVGLAAWRSLLVSLILPLSASRSRFPGFRLFSPLPRLVSLLVTLFPYYPVAFLRTSSLSSLNDRASFPLHGSLCSFHLPFA